MREDILELIRSEYRKEKQCNNQRKEFKRIFMNPDIYSFSSGDDKKIPIRIKNNFIKRDEEIISKIYPRYLDMINENETNGIYLYRGTYDYDFDSEDRSDFPIGYYSETAEYRAYEDIEYNNLKFVSIEECKKFESENTIIYSKDNYYKIQRDFFVEAVKFGQDSAKKLVLKKYNNKNI